MSRKELGNIGEYLAVRYLENNGYEVIARNYRRRGGEIDIVALRGEVLHFIEVKTRSSDRYGTARESVRSEQLEALVRTSAKYLAEKDTGALGFSFDLIAIDVQHLKGVI